jgi:chromate reductase, NAD(P)H dehydrogenase (quinone)
MTLILGISGSLRRDSYNRRLLVAAGRELPAHLRFEVLEGVATLPPYIEDLDVVPAPVAVRWFREAIAVSDAVIVATPEYNASVPGALKNALDWASRPFPDNSLRGKPTALVSASTGPFGALWALAELRKVMAAIGADVVQADLAVPRADAAFGHDGELRDPAMALALGAVVDDLLARILEQAA